MYPEIMERIEATERLEAFAVLSELRGGLNFADFCERLERLEADGYELWGARRGGRLVGVVGFRPVETMARGRHLHVDDLVVLSTLRGHGVGSALISLVERKAIEGGHGSVFFDSRREVVEFYAKRGFSPHPAVLMKKSLP